MLGRSLLPLLQFKCSFQNVRGSRKTVSAPDCLLNSPNVIPERSISKHTFDRRYKILWGRLVRGDDNAHLFVRYSRRHTWLIIGYG